MASEKQNATSQRPLVTKVLKLGCPGEEDVLDIAVSSTLGCILAWVRSRHTSHDQVVVSDKNDKSDAHQHDISNPPRLCLFDLTSGELISEMTPTQPPSSISHEGFRCVFLPQSDRFLVTNGERVGLRRDLSGVLMLETILRPVTATNKSVLVEIPYMWAVMLSSIMAKDNTETIVVLREQIQQILAKSRDDKYKVFFHSFFFHSSFKRLVLRFG